jgi:hypothetical protein
MLWNLYLFTTLASAAVVERRQVPQAPVVSIGPNGKKQVYGYNFDLEKIAPSITPVGKVVDLKNRFRSNSIRKETKFGPFTLPPAKVSTTPGSVQKYKRLTIYRRARW